MSRSSVRSLVWALVAVIGALIVSPWPAQAGQGPPSKPGNPGVPGLLAEIEALNAQIATLQGQITILESQARVARTGQTQCYDTGGNFINCDGTGQDGAIQAGVPFPTPRFTDNLNGTVTDNLTGLIWLQNANCFAGQNWANALIVANTSHDTVTPNLTDDCGLSDGSVAGALAHAWIVNLAHGGSGDDGKDGSRVVWPVRGGE